MATISTVCKNLFTETSLAKLEKRPDRGSRRNLARIVYRRARRPGLVNPLPDSEVPTPLGRPNVQHAKCVQRPMRHVYKLHEPPRAKHPLTMGMARGLPRRV